MELWQQHLQAHWGVHAELTALDGEFDLNFHARADDGRQYLLKVMRPGCDPRFVDMQCRALAHIRTHSRALYVSDVVVSSAGLEVESLEDEQGEQRLVWVLTFLEGIVYADFLPKSIQLVNQLGDEFGQLHQALLSLFIFE